MRLSACGGGKRADGEADPRGSRPVWLPKMATGAGSLVRGRDGVRKSDSREGV